MSGILALCIIIRSILPISILLGNPGNPDAGWKLNDHGSEQGRNSSVMTDSQPNWNPENALARVEGDSLLLRELIQLFLDDYPLTMADLQAAIAKGDTSAAERHAHTLKGAASNFEAGPVVTAGQ